MSIFLYILAIYTPCVVIFIIVDKTMEFRKLYNILINNFISILLISYMPKDIFFWNLILTWDYLNNFIYAIDKFIISNSFAILLIIYLEKITNFDKTCIVSKY